jgi:pyruvate-formate lyase-activating enzyme
MQSFSEQRRHMVERYRLAGYLRTDPMTRAMLRVPKEEFMDPSLIGYAYADQPFPIPGDGRQTISAPYMYPATCEPLGIKEGDRVLEIGAGSGYGAALAYELVGEKGLVVAIEINEPTMLFEYSLDVFPLAHDEGLYNTFVSNGYMTLEALRMLGDAGMDAIKFDVKGDEEAVSKYCGADVNVVWRNVGEARRLGMHVEVVTLVIPGVNDDEDCLRGIARRHLREAGPESPLHFTQFYPAYEMMDRPVTPVESLERAHSIAVEEGVRYVYAGNVPGHRLENTYCPDCGELLIGRFGFMVNKYRVTPDRKCPRCGLEIPILGEYVKSASLG